MPSARVFARKLGHLLRVYPGSLLGGWRLRRTFHSVETVCLFVGYPRSGHSLVGALLDAHPDALIAHEADILKYVFARFGRNQLRYLMLRNSQDWAAAGRNWEGYSYRVPGQWQGRYRTLRLIGDKHGESTTVRLMVVPGLLERTEWALGPNLKFVHVVRNPYDNIATIMRKGTAVMAEGVIEPSGDPLRDAVAYYFALCEGVAALKARIGDRMLDIRHEDVILRPAEELSRLCRFLGLEPSADYLASCAAVLFKEPHQSRRDAPWNAESLEAVRREASRFPFLSGYSPTGV